LAAVSLLLLLAPKARGADPLPVIIEMTGGGDQRWESIQETIGNLHVQKNVPLSIAAVPCTQKTGPGHCTDDESLHRQYQIWTFASPTVIEIGQQGRDNSEQLGNLSAAQQLALIKEGYDAMAKWGLANGKPAFFTPPNSNTDNDTIAAVEQLGYDSYAQVTAPCPANTASTSTRDGYCTSIPLCTNRVNGPSCVLRNYSAITQDITARAANGAVFLSFNPQDLSISAQNQSIDPNKLAAYSALLDSFASDSNYVMRTFDTQYRTKRGQPLPQASQPPPYPVMIESDDARDGMYENVTTALANLHFSQGVAINQATVACGQGSTDNPFNCVEDGFHNNYKDWIAAHPGLLEIIQHGSFHTEHYSSLTADQQKTLLQEGLNEMATWGLPNGRPFSFASPFSEVNSDLITNLISLGYHTVIENAGACPFNDTLDEFCNSISLCELSSGQRVEGPPCVLRSATDIINDVNALQARQPSAFIVYHVQDFLKPDFTTIDQAKITQFQAILQAIHNQETVGNFDPTTYDAYYRSRHEGQQSGVQLDPINGNILVGGQVALTGTNFSPGSVVKLYLSTFSGAQAFGPYNPANQTATQLTWNVDPSIPLGQGFGTLQVINTDQGFLESNLQSALVSGDATDNIPTITAIAGVSVAPVDPTIPVAYVPTNVDQGSTLTITGTGFNNPKVNLFTASGNKGPLTPSSVSATQLQVTIPANAPTGPGSVQVVNSPFSGNVLSNAVSVVVGPSIDIGNVSQLGDTVTVNGAGFSPLTVINFFNAQAASVANLGGLNSDGSAKIPLTFVNETQFTFQVPAGTVAGDAFVQALNPPFIPFTSTGTNPNGAFTVTP
jgi:hypothetical protein